MPGVKEAAQTLEYKGHPLRRKDNLVYYGSMADRYIIMLQIMESEKVQDLDVPRRVTVQLQQTDPKVSSKERVVKKAERTSFFEAVDIAAVWLDRALAGK